MPTGRATRIITIIRATIKIQPPGNGNKNHMITQRKIIVGAFKAKYLTFAKRAKRDDTVSLSAKTGRNTSSYSLN